MKFFPLLICFIMIHFLDPGLRSSAQTTVTTPAPAPAQLIHPPPVVNTISTPQPVAQPTSPTPRNQNKATPIDEEKPGRYEEYQSICRKNEYDLPSTLSTQQKEKRINNLKNRIKADPKQVKLKLQLLKEYLDQRNKTEAINYVNELKKEDLPSVDLSIATQSLAVFERSKLSAEKELVKISTDNPKNAEALKFLAEIYKSQDKLSDVTSVYEDLAKLTKLKYDEQLCEVYVLESYFQDAERYCLNAIKTNPKNPFPYIFMGVLLRETSKEKQAVVSFKESLKYGKTEMALVCLGELNVLKKDYATGAEFYRQALQIKPMSARAVLGQAWSELYANKFVEALSSFKTACSKDKKFLIEFRKAAKYLADKRNENTINFSKEAQLCSEL